MSKEISPQPEWRSIELRVMTYTDTRDHLTTRVYERQNIKVGDALEADTFYPTGKLDKVTLIDIRPDGVTIQYKNEHKELSIGEEMDLDRYEDWSFFISADLSIALIE